MNNTLHRFHRYALSRIVWPLSVLVGIFTAIGWSLAPDNLLTNFLAPFTSAAVVGGAFLFGEKLIRVYLWKVAYPELDFQGTWQGHTEYCELQDINDKDNSEFKPFKKNHDIRFKQDCLAVAVEYDETDAYHGWNSTVATLFNENGRVGLRYAYEVKYKQGEERDSRLPVSSKGLEELSVVRSIAGQKPKRVTGSFAHTSDGSRPIYSGTVVFERTLDEPEENFSTRIIRIIVNKWLKPPAE